MRKLLVQFALVYPLDQHDLHDPAHRPRGKALQAVY